MNWIKCSDRMPEQNQDVLFVGCAGNKARWVVSGVYAGGHFWDDEGWWKDDRVTHWMPTPKLPEEDKQ